MEQCSRRNLLLRKMLADPQLFGISFGPSRQHRNLISHACRPLRPPSRSRRWSSPEPFFHTSDVLSIVSPFAMAFNVFTRHTRTIHIRKSMITAFTHASPETYRLAIWRVPAFDILSRCPSIGEAGVTTHSCLQERSFAVTLPTRPASQRQLSYL